MKHQGQTLSAKPALDGAQRIARAEAPQAPSTVAAMGTAPNPQHLDAAAAASLPRFGTVPQAVPEGGVPPDDGARSAGPGGEQTPGAGVMADDRIFAAEFARLYQLPNAAAARKFMRRNEVPHIASGRDLFTRASWLAAWEARRAKNLTPVEYTTPRETMLATAAAMVGDLVQRGIIEFRPGDLTQRRKGAETQMNHQPQRNAA